MLNNNLDWEAIREDYNDKGYTRITDILQPKYAEKIAHSLIQEIDWELFYLSDNGSVSITMKELKGLNPQQLNQLNNKILSRAQHKFSYYYFRSALDNIKNKQLAQFYQYLQGEEFLKFSRFLTSEPSIHSVNGQAACYRPSCFLKRHNDSVNTEFRIAAYVFSFTEKWREEWGGLLHIEESRGNIIDTLIPTFNTLTIFKVPTWHFVSQVANYSPESRYTTTGWMLGKQ